MRNLLRVMPVTTFGAAKRLQEAALQLEAFLEKRRTVFGWLASLELPTQSLQAAGGITLAP